MSDDAEIIETAVSQGHDKRWRLLRRSDGLYAYDEETLEPPVYWLEDDGSERDVAAPALWKQTYKSGLFPTGESALVDACSTIAWLNKSLKANVS